MEAGESGERSDVGCGADHVSPASAERLMNWQPAFVRIQSRTLPSLSSTTPGSWAAYAFPLGETMRSTDFPRRQVLPLSSLE